VQLGQLLIWMACLLLFVFLVTSADSAAFVLGMLSGGGDPNPSRRSTLLWGSLTLMLAAGLLARDSADVNKAVAIAGAIPYAFLLLLQLLALLRSLMAEQFSNNAKNTG
jgi:choline-glycine betaine transporter